MILSDGPIKAGEDQHGHITRGQPRFSIWTIVTKITGVATAPIGNYHAADAADLPSPGTLRGSRGPNMSPEQVSEQAHWIHELLFFAWSRVLRDVNRARNSYWRRAPLVVWSVI